MPHISFSELKNWCQCPFYHKIVNLDKIRIFKGNEYTAFGTAIHDVCENHLLGKNDINSEKTLDFFELRFAEELKKLPKDVILRESLINQMRPQGREIIPHIEPALKEYFNSYETVSTEESIMIPIDDTEYNFKGFIDAVIKTSDGIYHIIDWKTCSWGWDNRKKNDAITTYQLTLYKYFYAKKHNISLDKIETHFALLKRTGKKNRVELFRVSSGKRKVDNAIKLVNKAITNIEKKRYIKNRLACTSGYGCPLYKTEHCP